MSCLFILGNHVFDTWDRMDLVLVIGMKVLRQRPTAFTHENREVIHFITRCGHDRVIPFVDNDGAAVLNVKDWPIIVLFFVKELGTKPVRKGIGHQTRGKG